jgi:hypothetical protein
MNDFYDKYKDDIDSLVDRLYNMNRDQLEFVLGRYMRYVRDTSIASNPEEATMEYFKKTFILAETTY